MKNIILLLTQVFISVTLFSQEWNPIASGSTLRFNSVSFGSDLVGYIGANDSTLLKTNDGGLTWNVQSTNGIQFSATLPDIIQVDFINENVGYAMIGQAQYAGYLYKTVDGGANWTLETLAMCSPIFSFHFDEDNSYAVGASCFGGKTIDKKVNGNWQFNSTYLAWGNEYLRTITFYDTLFGIAAGDSGQVHRTLDGGLTYDTINTIASEIIWDLHFVNDSTIYGAIDSLQQTLIFSTDSGKTWKDHTDSWTFFYPQLKALDGNGLEDVVAVGTGGFSNFGIILWGNNQGPFWRTISKPLPLNDVTMINDSLAIAVGDSGTIYKSTGLILNTHETAPEVAYKLYPNPANNYISMEGDLNQIIQIEFYDILGRAYLGKKDYPGRIDVAHLPNGWYKVSVVTHKNRYTQSMLIIH